MQRISSRRLSVTIVGAATALLVTLPDLPDSARRLHAADFAEALSGFASIALATLSLWLLVASLLVAFAARTGTGVALARRVAPAWLAVALSAGVVALAPAAQASPADLDGLPLPDRAPAVASAPMPNTPTPNTPQPDTPAPATTVTVQAGDCLWDLARAHAETGTSDGDLARLTAAWHRANQAVIGADPDLVLPGQVLMIPPESVRPTGTVAP